MQVCEVWSIVLKNNKRFLIDKLSTLLQNNLEWQGWVFFLKKASCAIACYQSEWSIADAITVFFSCPIYLYVVCIVLIFSRTELIQADIGGKAIVYNKRIAPLVKQIWQKLPKGAEIIVSKNPFLCLVHDRLGWQLSIKWMQTFRLGLRFQ